MFYKRFIPFVVFGSMLVGCKPSVPAPEPFLKNLMAKDPFFEPYLANSDQFEIQIIYTRINRDQNNVPHFSQFTYNVDSLRYFYPASTVKLPLVLLALEKLQELNIPRQAIMLHDSVYSGQISVKSDSTSPTGFPSVENYARKILVVSDNDAYNRLFEFMGRSEINHRLNSKGYQARILHRLERPLSDDENRYTEAVSFKEGNRLLFKQPMLVDTTSFTGLVPVLKGNGYMKGDSLVQAPFDFTLKNFYPLTTQHKLLQELIFPASAPSNGGFKLRKEDREFVLQYMSQLPGETRYPNYKADTSYYDAYCKFLMYGESREKIPASIRIFNKVGDAYGYLLDNAYIVDFEHGVEFMLSAVIHVNSDGIYNDSKYDYHSLGYPFFQKLGKLIYEYELKRPRGFKPDLTEFKFKYGEPE